MVACRQECLISVLNGAACASLQKRLWLGQPYVALIEEWAAELGLRVAAVAKHPSPSWPLGPVWGQQ